MGNMVTNMFQISYIRAKFNYDRLRILIKFYEIENLIARTRTRTTFVALGGPLIPGPIIQDG